MEVPQWLKNIWSKPERNNYAESLVPRGLLNNNNNSNKTRRNVRFNVAAPEFVPGAAATANQESQPVSLPRTLNPNAPAFTPSTGGKRRKHRRSTKKARKSRKTRKSRSKGQRR